jgi:hypothetical protein
MIHCDKVVRWSNLSKETVMFNQVLITRIYKLRNMEAKYQELAECRGIPGVLASFLRFFVVRKHIILKGNSFFVYTIYWPSDSTHFAHLPGMLWIPRQKKLILFNGKTFVEEFSNFFEIAEALLCKRVSHWCDNVIVRWRQVKGLQWGRKGCPIQAISRCLSLVLMRETGNGRVTKSLCHVVWPIPVAFRSMHDSNWSFLDDNVVC